MIWHCSRLLSYLPCNFWMFIVEANSGCFDWKFVMKLFASRRAGWENHSGEVLTRSSCLTLQLTMLNKNTLLASPFHNFISNVRLLCSSVGVRTNKSVGLDIRNKDAGLRTNFCQSWWFKRFIFKLGSSLLALLLNNCNNKTYLNPPVKLQYCSTRKKVICRLGTTLKTNRCRFLRACFL